MAAYFFASPIDVDVNLDGENDRKSVQFKSDKDNKPVNCPVYYDGESVSGQVCGLSICVYVASLVINFFLDSYSRARWKAHFA